MRFTLTIELGNEAMLTTADVAFALARAAVNVTRVCGEGEPYPHQSGPIVDANGNVVGEWSFGGTED